jgi:hypothetical protein
MVRAADPLQPKSRFARPDIQSTRKNKITPLIPTAQNSVKGFMTLKESGRRPTIDQFDDLPW